MDHGRLQLIFLIKLGESLSTIFCRHLMTIATTKTRRKIVAASMAIAMQKEEVENVLRVHKEALHQ